MINSDAKKRYLTDDVDLMAEWNAEKNEAEGIFPAGLLVGSHKKVWWRCQKCGYEWKSVVNKRAVSHHKCPACVGQAVHKGYNDLLSVRPDLAKELDMDRNVIKPDEIIAGGSKKYWWKCSKCNYEWQTTTANRMKSKGCPACANQVVWKGYNDLFTIYPAIAREWDTERNKVAADEVVFGSAKRAWWKCSKCGHSWNAVIVSRTANGNGCPMCARRCQTSFPEQAIFFYISEHFFDAENRYTAALANGMELDIYVPSLKIGIEYDGGKWHSGKQALRQEQEKYRQCQNVGITLYRVREGDVREDSCDVAILCDYKRNGETGLTDAIRKLFCYLQIQADIDVERDNQKIRERYYDYLETNSLAEKFPEIAAEWNYEKNESLTPEMVFSKAGEQVWWSCKKCSYHWKARVADRTGSRSRGCPACANKVVWAGHNDLGTVRPELCKEWDYEKNNLSPSEVVSGSNKIFWWRCKICGYEWKTSPNHRVRGRGCPACVGKASWRGHNDLATTHPQLLSEWDYVKNERNSLRPTEVTYGSKKSAAWMCSEGHCWKAVIYSRTKADKPTGCPICANQKILAGYNDLQSKFPQIAAEWDEERNGNIKPSEIAAFSQKKVTWVCSKGHHYDAVVSNRTRKGHGCPYCSGRRKMTSDVDNENGERECGM